jgi:carboxypeptidase D
MDEDNATEYETAPDDALFQFIAGVYASNNPIIMSGPFLQGISNGSAWYSIRGGMQDWLYYYHGCLALTVELSEEYFPDPSAFDKHWEANRNAMLAYMELARMGIHGIVTDAETGEPLQAQIRVDGIDTIMHSDPDVGDYHRMLLPGDYTVQFTADGYRSAAHSVVVNTDAPLVLNVELTPLSPPSDVGANPPSGGGAVSSSGGGGGGGGCFIDTLSGASFLRP